MTKKERNKVKDYLLDVFKDLEFNEELHRYTLKSKPNYRFKLSCSKIAELCKEPFDKLYWLERKSKELNVSKEELEKQWDKKRDVASYRGSLVHLALENELQGIKYEVDGELVPIEVVREIKRRLVKAGFKVIAAELRMYDEKYAICGTMDLLAYSVKEQAYYIIDWKTNRHKEIKKKETYICKYTGKERVSNFKFLPPFDHLQKNKFYEYSMQLSTYKLILERNTNIKIKGMILVQISDVLYDKGYSIIPCDVLNVEQLLIK